MNNTITIAERTLTFEVFFSSESMQYGCLVLEWKIEKQQIQ